VDSLFKSVAGPVIPADPNRFGPERAEIEIPRAAQQRLVSRLGGLIATVAIVTVMILSGFAAISAATLARPSTASAPLDRAVASVPHSHVVESAAAVHAEASPMVGAAVSSLDHGAGPASGVSANCAAAAADEAGCGGQPSHPTGAPGESAAMAHAPGSAVAPTDPHWYNVTANLTLQSGGSAPVVEFSGRMAYDPLLSEVVLFVGCAANSCYDNQTWVYNGMSWTNLTSTLATAPSGRQGAGLDYDPAFGGVVLFGGFNALGNALNDTWVFSATGWKNVTATVGFPVDVYDAPISGWGYGAMAYDPALGTMVLVDGCLVLGCTDVWGQTFFLNATEWTAAWGPGTLTNRTYLGWSSLAYDAADGYMLSFGGYDYYEGSSSNDTFTMSTWGTWDNITNHDAGCVASVCYTPQGRESTAMTWDGQLNAVLLVAGYNQSTDEWLNDSWTFSGAVWLPADLTSPEAPSSFCGTAQPALAEMSNNIAPFIIGGASLGFAGCWSNEWVFEVPPQAILTATPLPVDLGGTTTFSAGWVAGTGTGVVAGWNVSFGNGHSTSARSVTGQNSSTVYAKDFAYTYGTTGSFTANVTWTDFFYISATSAGLAVPVGAALVATITASALKISAGHTVTFTTSPTGGTAPYSYAWSFGDGATSAVQDPSAHTFAKAGTYVVNLTVTDAGGGVVHSSVTIVVSSAPAGLNLGSTGTYMIVGVVVVVLAILAALLLMHRRKKPTSAQPWQASAPPPGVGAEGVPPPPPPPT
jgi:PKD repeat protein